LLLSVVAHTWTADTAALANAKPDCPYGTAEELAKMLEAKTGIEVVIGTHDYH